MSSISFERAADYYDATRSYTPEVDTQITDAIVAAASATAHTRFLEVGIGTGRIAFPLITRGYAYAGIDLSPAMMDQLRRKIAAYQESHPGHLPLHVDLRLGDATALPYPDAHFDVVLTVHVLHLIANWQDAISEMLRVLRPGGIYLNGNDEAILPSFRIEIQELWLALLQQLGYKEHGQTRYAMRDLIVQELQRRGLPVEIFRPVTWYVATSPLDAFHYLARRQWSRTWNVPDDLFAESIRRLAAEVQRRYGDRLRLPERQQQQFVITRARKPG